MKITIWEHLRFCSLCCMTSRQERLRFRAMECYVAAQNAKDRQARKASLELMSGWRELADYNEGLEKFRSAIKEDQLTYVLGEHSDHQRKR
jgi:hypothetical protein